ncbi:hypothetical protein OAE26_01980 [Synechococcus sp. AH-551-E05]|nr:hypothetical protein [Synechococcus sp. AH-551-E05]MDB4651328.1 hypothetical protein [Synechococcus sp. AH-551-E05]
MTSTRKPRGYWTEERVIEELIRLSKDGFMPMQKYMPGGARRIIGAKGADYFAKLTGLTLNKGGRTSFWDDDSIVRWLIDNSIGGRMPKTDDMTSALQKKVCAKGVAYFAELAGLTPNILFNKKWDDDIIIKWLVDNSVDGYFPEHKDMPAGLAKCLNGRREFFQEATGLSVRPASVFIELDIPDDEVIRMLKQASVDGAFPTVEQMLRISNSLHTMVLKNRDYYIEISGLRCRTKTYELTGAKLSDWDVDSAVAKLQELSVNGMYPGTSVLLKERIPTLLKFILANGGTIHFAELAGLTLTKRQLAAIKAANNRAAKRGKTVTVQVTPDPNLPLLSNKDAVAGILAEIRKSAALVA